MFISTVISDFGTNKLEGKNLNLKFTTPKNVEINEIILYIVRHMDSGNCRASVIALVQKIILAGMLSNNRNKKYLKLMQFKNYIGRAACLQRHIKLITDDNTVKYNVGFCN